MPPRLIRERYLTRYTQRSPFVQHASLFQDLVIRCVRYAFANMPASIGTVFFCKPVALPFMRWRMLRHGYLHPPLGYKEIDLSPPSSHENGHAEGGSRSNDAATKAGKQNRTLIGRKSKPRPSTPPYAGLKGIAITTDASLPPDVVVYYLHGGGFSMGSSYFYLEFLMGLCGLLRTRPQVRPSESGRPIHRFTNPAILALEYSLVPTATYPTQLYETLLGYERALQMVRGDASRIVLAGDSAGATLVLSLLLCLGEKGREHLKPGFATLISPWCELVSEGNRDTRSDYLNGESLHLYARQYVGHSKALEKTSTKSLKGGEDHVEDASGVSVYVRRHPRRAGGEVMEGKGHMQTGIRDPIASPGNCTDLDMWSRASPRFGYHFVIGADEVFAPNARKMIKVLEKAGSKVVVTDQPGQIHAWPVVSLFLKDKRGERLEGLYTIVDRIAECLG